MTTSALIIMRCKTVVSVQNMKYSASHSPAVDQINRHFLGLKRITKHLILSNEGGDFDGSTFFSLTLI